MRSRRTGKVRNGNRKVKNKKNNIIICLAVMTIIALAFSGGVVSKGFFVFAIEILCIGLVFLTAALIKDEKKKKPGNVIKTVRTERLPEKSEPTLVSPKEDYAGSIRPKGKKFDWVVQEAKKGEAVKASEESEEQKVKDLKAEVARWSKTVDYSASVFGRLIDGTSQPKKEDSPYSTQADEENEASADPENEYEHEDLVEPFYDETEDIDEEEDFCLLDEVDEEEPVLHNELSISVNFSDNEAQEYEDIEEESNGVNQENLRFQREYKELFKSRESEDRTEYRHDKDERPKIVLLKGRRKNQEKLLTNKASQVDSKETKTPLKSSKLSLELLKRCDDSGKVSHGVYSAESNGTKLIDTLASFGVGARIINISQGPAVTRYEIQPDYGVKVSKIVNLTDDIALNLAATGVRIEAPIPGKAAVGIEVPNKEVKPVLLRDVIECEEFQNHPSKLAFAVGKDIAGNPVVADIAKMPHMLIAGATGSGKSVCINTLITSILYKASPDEVKLLMIDPKVVELSIYNGIPHLLVPVVTDPKKAAGALNWAVNEMTLRYRLFADNNVRDLKGYNQMMKNKGEDKLPQVVIIVDELADLMMVAPNDVEDYICRLAQMARAAGMHLVIATQRPSVDVITGVIKANVPSRISFAVSSQIDSRTILDMAGAEKLLGRGDMLFNPLGMAKPIRVQGGLITDKEVENIVASIKSNYCAQYDEEIIEKINSSPDLGQLDAEDDDELLPQVVEMIIEQGQASTSLVQRKFKLGYSRAARIIDQLEANGLVGPFEGSKPRRVLVTKQQWQENNG